MALGIQWLVFSAAVFLYPFIIVLYRLYFHPLAKFPGPKIAAATGWYETWIDLFQRPRGNFMEEITRMHDKYGPIVRINPHEIHIRDSTWIDTLYSGPKHGQRDKYPPTAYMTGTPKGIFGTVSHDLHRQRRAAINPLYSKANAGATAPLFYDNVELLLERMDDQIARGEPAEMRTSYLALATDNVSEHSTGLSRSLLRKEQEAVLWRQSIKTLAEWTLIGRHFSWVIPFVLKMPILPLRMVLPDFARIVGLHRVNTYIQHQHLAEKARDAQNVFQMALSNPNLPESEKVFNRISHEGVVAIAAGGETTARALTVATFFLLRNEREHLQRLEQELKYVMPDDSSRPSVRELERLPWLTAIIKESLRIMALPTTRFPLVASKEALRYKDWVIPENTPVSMTIREVLLDRDIFENPSEFQPERWLSTNPNLEKLNHYFVPFGRGNRMCIGINLAWAELYITLASLFRRRKLQLYDTLRERDIDVARDCFIGETSPNTKGVRVIYEKATV
ncbi:putative flavonoid 3-hydroxylase [Biscogniauxia marginata]|nr:putative flavonoid 3-hydroxylase [Biscogniauxia marginata]